MNNWDDLRHFLAVSRLGSLSAAAQQLGVDQSTVYRRLKTLEAYLGTQIFDHRQHGKYQLTPAGESLLSQASQIEQATFNIERDVLGRDYQLSGSIRVTTAEDIAVALLPRHLQAFQRAYPKISVELLTGNRYFSLARSEADVAIRPGYASTEERIIPRKLMPTYFGLFASEPYLQRMGSVQTRDDLTAHHLLHWRGDLAKDGFASYLDEVNARKVDYGSNSLLTHRAMAEAGLGIAFLPEFLGGLSDDLVRVLPDTRIDSGNLWILHHDDLRNAARLRAFIEYMTQALREDPALTRYLQ